MKEEKDGLVLLGYYFKIMFPKLVFPDVLQLKLTWRWLLAMLVRNSEKSCNISGINTFNFIWFLYMRCKKILIATRKQLFGWSSDIFQPKYNTNISIIQFFILIISNILMYECV